MKKLTKYWNNFQGLIYGKSVTRFEDKLLLLATLSISIILIFVTISNFSLGLKMFLVISTFAGVFLYFGLYLYGRYIARGNLLYWFLGVMTIGYTDLLWFFNYGSNGSILPLFIVIYAFLILVFNKKYFFLISILLYTNLICLFLVESRFQAEIGNYTNLESRLIDNYVGIVICLLVIYAYISAIKKNYIFEFERAQLSDQLKSSFLANMSHEIRTPLNAIVGFSSLVFDPDISEDDKSLYHNMIQKNSDSLISLIEDIIDTSKIESNQLTIKIQEVDVVPLIDQIIQYVQFNIPENKQIRVFSGIKEPKIIVKTDRLRLEQIMRNLLSNAVKYTENGQVEIDCEKGKEFFTFSVRDTGIGIHAEHHQLIFDRFRKLENQRQHLYRGTGIGLFLVKQLVEIMGGKIWVESEIGKGSTFYFTIPV